MSSITVQATKPMSPALQRIVEDLAEAKEYGRQHADGYIAYGEPEAIARAVAIYAEYFDRKPHSFAIRAGRYARIRQVERNTNVGIRPFPHLYAHTGGQS